MYDLTRNVPGEFPLPPASNYPAAHVPPEEDEFRHFRTRKLPAHTRSSETDDQEMVLNHLSRHTFAHRAPEDNR